MWVITLILLLSAIARSNTGVLVGTGSIVLGSYLLGIFHKVKEYMPTMLADGNSLLYGTVEAETYRSALAVTIAASILCFVISIPIFNKKQL